MIKQSYLIFLALSLFALTQTALAQDIPPPSHIHFFDDRLVEALETVLGYVEGSLGAVIMVLAGLMAIVSAAFGQYRAALALFVVAVGAFVLRTFIVTFFQIS